MYVPLPSIFLCLQHLFYYVFTYLLIDLLPPCSFPPLCPAAVFSSLSFIFI